MVEKKDRPQNQADPSEFQHVFTQSCQRKPYQQPMLQWLNPVADITEGASTSNQLENSNGLIGS